MLTDELFLGTKLYHKKFAEFCKPIERYLGVTQATYVHVDKHGRIFSIFTKHKPMENYIANQHYKYSTMYVNPNNMHNGFAVDNSAIDEKYKNVVLYDFITKFDWHNSFLYAEKDNAGGYFAIDFATTASNYKIFNKLINERRTVKKLIRDLNDKITLMAHKDLQENKMDFATLRGDSFHTARGRVFHEQHEQQNKIQLLRESGLLTEHDNGFLDKIHLSPQETNCLKIYQTTHSVKAVARDLDLATTTVTSYIENIKNKLNCNNKNELFEKAEILESLGYI